VGTILISIFANFQQKGNHSLVGGFKHFLFFQNKKGMSSFPLTNSYFSRWLLHHQPVKHFLPNLIAVFASLDQLGSQPSQNFWTT